MNVLLLEDNPFEQNKISTILEENDFLVHPCKTPDDVKDFREKLKDDDSIEPDLLIFDINLDRGQSGIDVACKYYSSFKKRPPLIWLTNSYNEPSLINRIKKEGLPHENFLPRTLLANEEGFIQAIHNAILSSTISADWMKKSKRRIGFQTEDGFTFIGKHDFLYATTGGGGTGDCILYLSSGKTLTVGGGRGLAAVQRYMERQFDNLLRLHSLYLINLEKIDKIEGNFMYFMVLEGKSRPIEIGEGDRKLLRKEGIIFDTKNTRRKNKT